MSEETITATRLRRELGDVLDRVLAGCTVHVTRQGRPLCTISPPTQGTEPTVPAPLRDLDQIA